MGWSTIYAAKPNRDLLGTWHNYEFKFRLSSSFRRAKNIRLFACYYYQQQFITGSPRPGVLYTAQEWVPFANMDEPIIRDSNNEIVPQQIDILNWNHWSNVYHVVDFVSYQWVFNLSLIHILTLPTILLV